MQPSYTPYHYCFNDPVNGSDPSGLCDECGDDSVLEPVYHNHFGSPLGGWIDVQLAANDEAFTHLGIEAFMVTRHRTMSDGLPLGPVDSDVYVDRGPRMGGHTPKIRKGDQVPKKTSKDLPEGVIENSSHTFNDYNIKYFVNYSDVDIKDKIAEAYSNWKRIGIQTRLEFIYKESHEGKTLDFKHSLLQNAVYIYDGYAYNRDEMGNYLWGAVVGNFGIPLSIAQFGAEKYAQSKTGKPDQYWEVWAYSRAIQKYFIPPIPEWPYPSHIIR